MPYSIYMYKYIRNVYVNIEWYKATVGLPSLMPRALRSLCLHVLSSCSTFLAFSLICLLRCSYVIFAHTASAILVGLAGIS